MKLQFSKICSGLAVSVAILAIYPAAYGQQSSGPWVNSASGGAVKDPFGVCVRSLGGSDVAECLPPTPVTEAPPPQPRVVTLGADSLFDFDKATLKPSGREALDALVNDIRGASPDFQVAAIDVVGHTDSIGTEQYNQGLSERRAATVRDYLASQGVPEGAITARGEGELQPIANNTTTDGRDNPEGRQQNRRVEVTVEAQR